LAACVPGATPSPVQEVPGGAVEQGRLAIRAYGCGACHVIPGIPGARGQVGPPLTGFGERTSIAGRLANTPENLVRWLQNPQAVEPGNIMPNLGVSEPDARDIAAYLYTLR
jgi:cytochrome c1